MAGEKGLRQGLCEALGPASYWHPIRRWRCDSLSLGVEWEKKIYFLVCSEAAETDVNVTTPPPEPVPDFKVH